MKKKIKTQHLNTLKESNDKMKYSFISAVVVTPNLLFINYTVELSIWFRNLIDRSALRGAFKSEQQAMMKLRFL
ncbi:hypothetical protein T08_12485 [Trichinella sp. T8]|nr:hypothetical protein T08_12485 [Trichinella sp. T8]